MFIYMPDLLENYQTDYMVQQTATIDLFFSFSVPTFVTTAIILYSETVDKSNTILLVLQGF